MRRSKVVFITVIFIISTGFVNSYADVYFFGQGRFVSSSGSASGYKTGEKDFPLTSSYNALGFGMGLSNCSKCSGPIFFGLEAQYHLSGKATMTDTLDNDTVEINTYKYLTGLAFFGINIFKSSGLRFFISGGVGSSYAINVEMKTYTSEYGYETEIEPPETKYPFTAFGGVGVVMKFSPRMGLLLSGRYQHRGTDQPQNAIVTQAGLVLSF